MAELDIAAFLRARLDEREAVALAATPGPWESEGDDPTDDEVYTVHDGEHGDLVGNVVAFARGGDRQQPNTVHIADNDPEFVLADVAAKRQIIDWCGEVVGDRDLTRCGEFGALKDDPDALAVTLAVQTLRLLALPYAGHPDDADGEQHAFSYRCR